MMIGLESPLPGRSAAQRILPRSRMLVGAFSEAEAPFPCLPRNAVQSAAAVETQLATTNARVTVRFMLVALRVRGLCETRWSRRVDGSPGSIANPQLELPFLRPIVLFLVLADF